MNESTFEQAKNSKAAPLGDLFAVSFTTVYDPGR